MAQLASTSESWKQQLTRRNLTLRKLVEQLRDSRIAEILKKQGLPRELCEALNRLVLALTTITYDSVDEDHGGGDT